MALSRQSNSAYQMIDDSKDISQKLNHELEKDARGALHNMLNNIERFGIVDTGKSFRFLQYKLGYDSGHDIDRIGFRMHRYTLLQEHGVGRGHPKNGHDAARAAEGGKRKPRPWFTDALEKQVPKMADTVAEHEADKSVRASIGKDKTFEIGK